MYIQAKELFINEKERLLVRYKVDVEEFEAFILEVTSLCPNLNYGGLTAADRHSESSQHMGDVFEGYSLPS